MKRLVPFLLAIGATAIAVTLTVVVLRPRFAVLGAATGDLRRKVDEVIEEVIDEVIHPKEDER